MAIKMIKKNAGSKTKVEQQRKFIAALEQKIEKVKREMEAACNNEKNDSIKEIKVGLPERKSVMPSEA